MDFCPIICYTIGDCRIEKRFSFPVCGGVGFKLACFFMPDILQTFAGIDVNQVVRSLSILENIGVAVAYLAMPYLIMVVIDLRSKKKMSA